MWVTVFFGLSRQDMKMLYNIPPVVLGEHMTQQVADSISAKLTTQEKGRVMSTPALLHDELSCCLSRRERRKEDVAERETEPNVKICVGRQ
jgi:hypothetical protein